MWTRGGESRAYCVSGSGECGCFEMTAVPKRHVCSILWQRVSFEACLATSTPWGGVASGKRIPIYDSRQSPYFMQPQEKVNQGPTCIKTKQVFIINAHNHLVPKHCWAAKTFQAEQIPKMSEVSNMRNSQWTFLRSANPLNSRLSVCPTGLRLAPETLLWSKVLPFTRPVLQRPNTQDRDPSQLPSSTSVRSSVFQIDFSCARKSFPGIWWEEIFFF